MTHGSIPVSGNQYTLQAGTFEAVIASVGASLRVLRDARGDLVVPYEADEMRPDMRGALLAPWPNRTADGRYKFGGVVHQLPLSEPHLGNAAHGLVTWLDFSAVRRTENNVTLAATIQAQPGYPWRVSLEVSLTLDSDGLTHRVTATNESGEPAPFGLGGHPYLVAGPVHPGAIDEWYLELPADEVLLVSPERLLPVGTDSVAQNDHRLDFRERRRIGATEINHSFGALRKNTKETTLVRVTDHEGYGVELECGPAFSWVQIYTADAASEGNRRHAVAVEPMTCPPDALNSTTDLVVIPPGSIFSAEWSIRRLVP